MSQVQRRPKRQLTAKNERLRRRDKRLPRRVAKRSQDAKGLRAALAEAEQQQAAGLFVSQGRQIAELALKNRTPSIFHLRELVEAGGLMSYGQNLADYFRRAAVQVDKIPKGTNPSEIPVEQPAELELFINGKTAKALGLVIPQELRWRAAKVIE